MDMILVTGNFLARKVEYRNRQKVGCGLVRRRNRRPEDRFGRHAKLSLLYLSNPMIRAVQANFNGTEVMLVHWGFERSGGPGNCVEMLGTSFTTLCADILKESEKPSCISQCY